MPALISPLAVARLDSRPPRLVLPALYWFEALVFLALAWVAVHFSLVLVLALALIDGLAALTARALARAATVSVTSAAGLLREGNAVANAGFSVCFMLGPAIGGAVVAAGGTSTALIADGCLFGVIGLTLATATGLPKPAPTRAPAKGRVRAAIEYARQRVVIRRLVLLQIFGVLFFTISVPVEVVFAEHSLHAGSAGYGALLSAWGAGAVAGAAIYARWRALPSRSLIVIGAASLGIGFLVMAIAPDTGRGDHRGGVRRHRKRRRGGGRPHRAPGGDGRAVDGADDELQRGAVPVGTWSRDRDRGRDHRARKPAGGAGGGGRRIARDHRGGLVYAGFSEHDTTAPPDDGSRPDTDRRVHPSRPPQASGSPDPLRTAPRSAHPNGGPASQGGPHDETPPAPIGRHQ